MPFQQSILGSAPTHHQEQQRQRGGAGGPELAVHLKPLSNPPAPGARATTGPTRRRRRPPPGSTGTWPTAGRCPRWRFTGAAEERGRLAQPDGPDPHFLKHFANLRRRRGPPVGDQPGNPAPLLRDRTGQVNKFHSIIGAILFVY